MKKKKLSRRKVGRKPFQKRGGHHISKTCYGEVWTQKKKVYSRSFCFTMRFFYKTDLRISASFDTNSNVECTTCTRDMSHSEYFICQKEV